MNKVPKEEEVEVGLVPGVYEVEGEQAVMINGIPRPSENELGERNVVERGRRRGEVGFGRWILGRGVVKRFGKEMYNGIVRRYDRATEWYRVEYDDGDSEDMDWVELEEVLLPLDVNLPLRSLALKMLKKSKQHLLLSSNSRGRLRRLRPFPKTY